MNIELNHIYNEDCLEGLRQIPDKFVDLCVTDPPYNVGKDYGNKINDEKSEEEFYNWINPIWHEIRRVSKGVMITVGMVNFVNIEKPNWIGAWIKSNQCSRNRYGGFNIWEPILIYGELGQRIKQDAWNYPIKKQKNVGNHPCPKLLDFWEILVSYAPENGIVLDPFMGSGTTAIAAKKQNKKYIGFEINFDYIKIAESRLNES